MLKNRYHTVNCQLWSGLQQVPRRRFRKQGTGTVPVLLSVGGCNRTLWVRKNDVVDWHRFDAKPDPYPTFHFDANPDPDPDPTPVLENLSRPRYRTKFWTYNKLF
jgi:hypothetical protein